MVTLTSMCCMWGPHPRPRRDERCAKEALILSLIPVVKHLEQAPARIAELGAGTAKLLVASRDWSGRARRRRIVNILLATWRDLFLLLATFDGALSVERSLLAMHCSHSMPHGVNAHTQSLLTS